MAHSSAIVRYLTHPQVAIDAAVPVPLWGLSDVGRKRTQALAASGAFAGTGRIVSSGETKAIETARMLADALGVALETREAMHENDRSATGFLPPPEFEATADRFFAEPDVSIRGWETARDAQARIVREANAVLAMPSEGDLLFVGHGGVGTLLLCHLMRWSIARTQDQPPNGGGNVFAFEWASRRVIHGWQSIETVVGR